MTWEEVHALEKTKRASKKDAIIEKWWQDEGDYTNRVGGEGDNEHRRLILGNLRCCGSEDKKQVGGLRDED